MPDLCGSDRHNQKYEKVRLTPVPSVDVRNAVAATANAQRREASLLIVYVSTTSTTTPDFVIAPSMDLPEVHLPTSAIRLMC